jgi:hypothetical protein
MWRSIFVAAGIMFIIVGVECLVIDSADFYSAAETNARSFANPLGQPSVGTREWRPKEWFPWAFLSLGAITVLYAFTLPKRFGRAAVG